MDKTALLKKLDETVAAMREAYAKDDGSTMKTMMNSMKLGFESFKASFNNNDSVKRIVEDVKQYMDSFDDAMDSGNRDVARNILESMETRIREFKAMHPDEMYK